MLSFCSVDGRARKDRVSPGRLGGGESLRIVFLELAALRVRISKNMPSKWISYDEHMLGVCLSDRRVEVGNGGGRKKRGVVALVK
jgi:hypothetical protein